MEISLKQPSTRSNRNPGFYPGRLSDGGGADDLSGEEGMSDTTP